MKRAVLGGDARRIFYDLLMFHFRDSRIRSIHPRSTLPPSLARRVRCCPEAPRKLIDSASLGREWETGFDLRFPPNSSLLFSCFTLEPADISVGDDRDRRFWRGVVMSFTNERKRA